MIALGILSAPPRVPPETAAEVLALVRRRRVQWNGRLATIKGPQYAGVMERLGRPDLAAKMRVALDDIDRNMGILLTELERVLEVDGQAP